MAYILALAAVFSISRGCNYVGPAKYYTRDGDYNDNEEHVREPRPVNFCSTETNGTHSRSRVFLCAPWGSPYAFTYDSVGCVGEPSVSEISGDYECGSQELCNVFHVSKTDIEGSDACVADANNYGEYLTLADQCITVVDDNDRYGEVSIDSIFATCDPITNELEYNMYRGVPDCSGAPNATLAVTSGECVLAPEMEMERAVLSLVNCGKVDPHPTVSAATCSFIRNATWWQSEEYHYYNPSTGNYEYERSYRRRGGDGDLRTLGPEVCVNRYRDGNFSTRLWFCSDVLQRAFLAEWEESPLPGQCNTNPDEVHIMDETSAENFACHEPSGPCAYAFFRTSHFEDATGNGECVFGDNYDEMMIAVDMCFADGDKGARAECTGTDFTYSAFTEYDACPAGAPEQSVALSGDKCYILDGDEFGTEQTAGAPNNYTYFQALQCKDTSFVSRPNCRFVENPVWPDPDQYARYKDRTDDRDTGWDRDMLRDMGLDGFREPIGQCVSKRRGDEGESYMYLCAPFANAGVVVAVWDAIECGGGSGELLYITQTMNTDFECSGFCDNTILVQVNDVASLDAADCNENTTYYEQKAFLSGCTDSLDFEDGGSVRFGSTKLTCDVGTPGELTYEVYPAPGCPDTVTPQGITVNPTAPCTSVGDGPLYMQQLRCGANPTTVDDNQCSYVVSPQWNATDGDGWRVQDGAFPLTTQICIPEYRRGRRSTMMFCDYQSQLAFIAIWNESLACSGFPGEIYEMTSALDILVCGSDDALANCDYAHVSMGEATPGKCAPQNGIMEHSVRMIGMCWPGEGDDAGTSWKVDCVDDTATIQRWNQSNDCSGEGRTVTVRDGECTSEFGDDGDTYFRLNYCSASTSEPTTTQAETSTTGAAGTGTTGSGTTGTGTTATGTGTTVVAGTGTTAMAGTGSTATGTGTTATGTVTTETSAATTETTTSAPVCVGDANVGTCFDGRGNDCDMVVPGGNNWKSFVPDDADDSDICDICTKGRPNNDPEEEPICYCAELLKSEIKNGLKALQAYLKEGVLEFCFNQHRTDDTACESVDDVEVTEAECACTSLKCTIDGKSVTGGSPDVAGEGGAYSFSISVAVWIGLVGYAMQ